MKTIGPFETKNANLTLISLTDKYLYLIKLSLISSFKYHASLQIPFLFSRHIDKIKSESLEKMKNNYSWTQIELNNDFAINVSNNNKWKNTITLNGLTEHYKLTILERDETDYYISVMQDYYGDRIKIIIE